MTPPAGRLPGEPSRPPDWVLRGSPRLRRRLGSARRTLTEAAQRLDPSVLALARPGDGTGTAVVCVYRRRNAAVVRAALRPLGSRAVARLWALDEVAPDLHAQTVGSGPGTRFALLQSLIGQLPPHARSRALVLLDDDVRFVAGDVARLVETGIAHGLDVWQPSHTARSAASFGFVRRTRGTVLRRTEFVEQGPVVVLSTRAQRALLPLPQDMGMGWGVEARWSATARGSELTMGIVDAVGVRHLVPGATEYDRPASELLLERELAAHGLASITDLFVERSRVRLHRRRSRG